MEKKIERVPYISKWYKEELDWSQLFKFDFKDEPTTEKTAKELNDCFKNTHVYLDKDVWNSTITISPTLKFEHHLTKQDVSYLRELIRLTRIDIESIKHVHSKESDARYRLGVIENYIRNAFGIRDKAQEKQLEELIEQSNPKKSYEGTLCEHWKELSELFYIKSNFEHWEKLFNDVIIPDLKLYGYVCPRTEFNIYYYKRANDVYNSLGIEFIEDFVKACEKCED